MLKQILSETNNLIQSKVKQEHTPVEWWRSSSLGSCMRGRLLSRLFAGEVYPTYDETTLGIFRLGHLVEESIIDVLRQSEDWVIFTQGEMYDKEFNVKGHFDALLLNTKTNDTLLLECKSRNSNAFKFATKDASIQYKMQAHSYLYMLNNSGFEINCDLSKKDPNIRAIKKIIDTSKSELNSTLQKALLVAEAEKRAVEYAIDNLEITPQGNDIYKINLNVSKAYILYVNKDTYELTEFEVNLNDSQLQSAWQYELNTLNNCWKTKTAPLPTSPSDWQSKYCQFCKAGTCQSLDDKNLTEAIFNIYEQRTGIKVK